MQLALAVWFVLPLGGVSLCGTTPVVVFCPTDGVVEHLLVLEHLIYLHVAGMISGIIPEGTNLWFVVSLPVVIHLGDEFHHLFMIPLSGSLHLLLVLFLDLGGLLGWLRCAQRQSQGCSCQHHQYFAHD